MGNSENDARGGVGNAEESSSPSSPSLRKLPSTRDAANLVATAETNAKKALGSARDAFVKAASKAGLIGANGGAKPDDDIATSVGGETKIQMSPSDAENSHF